MTNATDTTHSFQLRSAPELPIWLEQVLAVLSDGHVDPIAPHGWAPVPEPVYVSADEDGHLWIAPELFGAL